MSIKNDYIAVRNWFISEWGNTTPVAEENVFFSPPANKSAYVSFEVLFDDGLQISIGENYTMNQRGIVMVGIYCPENSGPGLMLDLVGQLVDMFKHKSLAPNIIFEDHSIQNTTRYREGYYKKTFLVRFSSYTGVSP